MAARVLKIAEELGYRPNSIGQALVRRIDRLSEQGVPVVTFNTDAPDSRRLCFVGMDNYRAGQTAAGLIRQMLRGGDLSFVLDQVARPQDRRPLQILHGLLLNGNPPEREFLCTDILIRTRYNSGLED